jgi:hypothetical protein
MVALKGGVLLFFDFSIFHTALFNSTGLLSSLAFCEWLLCTNCVVSVSMLTAALDATAPR